MNWGIPLLRTNIKRAHEQRKPDLLQECLQQIQALPEPTDLESLIMQNIVRQEWLSVWYTFNEQVQMLEVQFNRLPEIPGALETIKMLTDASKEQLQ